MAKHNRTNEPIPPNELQRKISGWKCCPDCRDKGIIGTALEQTLAFCNCPAGIEKTYVKGADWPAQEIARVHADAKSLLVAACHALRFSSTGDTLADSNVSKSGGMLQIQLPDWCSGIDESEIQKATELLQWECQIAVAGGWSKHQRSSAAERNPAGPSRPPIGEADVA